MKNLVLVTFLCFAPIQAQVTVECNDVAAELVDILVNGVPFSNATLSGFECSTGSFDGANSNIGLESGMVMCTGGVDMLPPGGTESTGGGTGDPDLEQQFEMAMGGNSPTLFDVLILEFDFVPNSNQISFEYVFGSNEYPEFVCSGYNDMFAFFLSGPGINGPFSNNAINIARVPDPNNPNQFTDTPVMINTINPGVSGSSGTPDNCDDIDGDWESYSMFYTDNITQETVALDGFTTPLIAKADVVPCETYHIKLAIADAGDSGYNSAVFLLENSFSSPPGAGVEQQSSYSGISGNDTTLVEGCYPGEINFELNGVLEVDYVIDYDVTGSATNGVDYNEIEGQIVIPSGELEATIIIDPIYDGMIEGMEDVTVSATISDGCTEELRHYTFNIIDRVQLAMDLPVDTGFCPGADEIVLDPNLIGGIDPISYLWQFNGATYSNQETITVTPEEIGMFTFTASDLCDSDTSGEIETYLIEPEIPLAIHTTFDEMELCVDDYATTQFSVIGGVGETSLEWTINDLFVHDSLNFTIPTDVPLEYNYELIVADECSNSETQGLLIKVKDCFIPNIFTPNDDGQNDYWYVDFGEAVKNVRVDIFNRWGQIVYTSLNYELCEEITGYHCWNGEHMSYNSPCQEGTYYYTFELLDGRKHRGVFNLFR
jgi:gliding motility-associated-like protein